VKLVATEAQEQSSLMQWSQTYKIKGLGPLFDYMFAIPNGGSRNKIEAVNLKKQGVKAGVPDLFICVPSGDYHGLFIEMKSKNGIVSDKQLDWIYRLKSICYRVEVCYGQDEAREAIINYLEGN